MVECRVRDNNKSQTIVINLPAGPIFGCRSSVMLRQPVANFLELGPRGLESLLHPEDASKRGNLKTGMGPREHHPGVCTVPAFHADGSTMAVLVQVSVCSLF
jgi:hypothetical protein